jgi:hypothetical protein
MDLMSRSLSVTSSTEPLAPAVLGPAALWGIAGVALLLGNALVRLLPMALQPVLQGQLGTREWILYGASVLFNGYAEGYRAFQKQFSPRVVRRALTLARAPRRWFALLAPFYCMGLFHATRKRLVVSWSVLSGVVVLVVAVRMLEQPWRGIVDAGVVVGLAWGLLALACNTVRAVRGLPVPGSADLPD